MRTVGRAVVTGATGAVGSALVRLLLERGKEVAVLCRPDSTRLHQLPRHPALQLVPADLMQLTNVPLEGTWDAFFHLAWMGTTGAARNDPKLQLENIRGALEAVDLAARLHCQVFIGVGSQAEYGRVEGRLRPETPTFPETGYGIAKLSAGQLTRLACGQKGIAHIWTRILSVYGPGDGAQSLVSSVLQALLLGQEPQCTAGEQLWDYLYSEDAARALWLMAEKGTDGAVYPLGSGDARPLRDYILAMRDAVDPALPVGLGKRPYPPGQVMHLCADLTALTKDTGFVPTMPFAEGIKKTIDWMKENFPPHKL